MHLGKPESFLYCLGMFLQKCSRQPFKKSHFSNARQLSHGIIWIMAAFVTGYWLLGSMGQSGKSWVTEVGGEALTPVTGLGLLIQ